MSPILSPIDAALRFLASFKRPARLLIAVSGGSDSIGLLVALNEAVRSSADIVLLAATIDHRLRPESAAESRQVADLCTKLGIRHYARAWVGDKPKTGISAASREARYRLLVDIGREARADAIVTAHTLDDQHETIAMRTERSRTMESPGLAGMAQAVLLDKRIWMLRPMITCRRADIRAYLTDRGYGWVDDPSNDNPAYERVRTRRAIAAGEGGRVLADGRAVAERRRLLSENAADLLEKHAQVHHGVLVVLSPECLIADRAVLVHALSALMAVLGGRPHGPGSDRMDRIMTFLSTGEPGRMTAGRVLLDRRRTGLYMMRESRDILPLCIEAGGHGIFDGRFAVAVDRSAGPVRVECPARRVGGLPAGYDDAPAALARAAARLLPKISDLVNGDACERTATVVPVLAPYDRFLPVFDLALANRIAMLFGRTPFPSPPVQWG